MREPLLKTIAVAGEFVDMGSDFHEHVQGLHGVRPADAARKLAQNIVNAQKSRILVLAGDLFDAENAADWQRGLDVSEHVNELMTLLARDCERILYVPGNHCLRRMHRTEDPWSQIDSHPKVVMPRGTEPLVVKIGNARVLLSNVFYDGGFIPHHPLQGERYASFMDSTTDGRHLFHGSASIPMFRTMTENTAAALQRDIDMLVTHVPVHPSSAYWNVGNLESHDAPPDFEGHLRCNPEYDNLCAYRWRITPEQYRQRHNEKAAMLGSNVFDPSLGAHPKDNLSVVFGHHHKNEDRAHVIHGIPVRFLSHQAKRF